MRAVSWLRAGVAVLLGELVEYRCYSVNSPQSKPALAAAPRWDKSMEGELVASRTMCAASQSSTDSKVAPLHAYRRASGLCQYCAEKWEKATNALQLFSSTQCRN
jgi:hypothetical protein